MSIAQEDQIFADILEAEKMFVRNREEMLKYEARERYEMDCASLKSDGIEEGKQIGREEGAKSKTIQVAKKMLKQGLDDKLIMLCTEISVQKLESIKNTISLQKNFLFCDIDRCFSFSSMLYYLQRTKGDEYDYKRTQSGF